MRAPSATPWLGESAGVMSRGVVYVHSPDRSRRTCSAWHCRQLMDMIVAGYDFEFKMGWPRAYSELVGDSTPLLLRGIRGLLHEDRAEALKVSCMPHCHCVAREPTRALLELKLEHPSHTRLCVCSRKILPTSISKSFGITAHLCMSAGRALRSSSGRAPHPNLPDRHGR